MKVNCWARIILIVTFCYPGIIFGDPSSALIDVQIPDVLIETDGASPISESLIVNMIGTGAEQMAGYTFSIEITPQVGTTGSVSLTGASDIAGQLIDSSNLGFVHADAFDIIADLTDSGTVSAITGDLFELIFLVAADADGVFDVQFILDTPSVPNSEVQNGMGLPISTNFIDGVITVTAPEPTTAVIFISVALTLFIRRN